MADELFERRPVCLKLLFQKVMDESENGERVSAGAAKSCLVFIAAKSFLAV